MYMATGTAVLTAAADAAGAAKLWFTSTNAPPTVFVIVRAWQVTFTPTAAINVTTPAVIVQRMSFTGAAAAAIAGTPVQALSSMAAPQGRMSGLPGGVITAGNNVKTYYPNIQGTATPDIVQDPQPITYLPTPIILVAGESIALAQRAAGAAAEARSVIWTVWWDEEPLTSPLGRWFGPRAV